MIDLISRQAAYDTLTGYYHHTTEIQHKVLREALERVPSTQPETHEKRTETHACDLIDRHDAIYELYEKYHGMISDESMKIYKIIEWLKSLPSAQQERKKGKWIKAYDGNDDHVKCTGCFKTYDWISQAQYYNYCPNCGADMRGEQDE